MANRYNKRFVIENFVTDTVVIIRVPKEDRGTLDHPRLYARVVDRRHPERYQLQTERGILDRLHPTGVLNRVPNPELVGMSLLTSHILNPIHLFIPLLVSALDLSSSTSVITLHRAAAPTSQATEIFLYCTCSHISTCQSRRCKCFRSGAKCTNCSSALASPISESPTVQVPEVPSVSSPTPPIIRKRWSSYLSSSISESASASSSAAHPAAVSAPDVGNALATRVLRERA